MDNYQRIPLQTSTGKAPMQISGSGSQSNPSDPGAATSDSGSATSVRAGVGAAIARAGGVSAIAATAAPTLVFLGADAVGGLRLALAATAVTAAVILGWRVRARHQVKHALVGALLATACAVLAAGTGESRDFFVVPMVVPAAAAMVCLLSVLADRPLAALVANRIVGGPPQWRTHRPLHRFYMVTTLLIALVSVVSLVAQIALYHYALVAWLAVLHIGMGPMWAAITAASVVMSRRAVTRYRIPAEQER